MRKVTNVIEVNLFDEEQKLQIELGLREGLSEKQIVLYAKPEFNFLQMEQVRLGLVEGLSEEQVRFYATPEFDWWMMETVRRGFEKGLTVKEMKPFIETGCHPETLDVIFDLLAEYYGKTTISPTTEGLQNGVTLDDIRGLIHLDTERIDLISHYVFFYGVVPLEKARPLIKQEFSYEQLLEIFRDFVKIYQYNRLCEREGVLIPYWLTEEHITFYARPEFDVRQMRQIKFGFRDGLPWEKVSFYAKPEFTWYQMKKIRETFRNGFTIDYINRIITSDPLFKEKNEVRKTNPKRKRILSGKQADEKLFEFLRKHNLKYMPKSKVMNWCRRDGRLHLNQIKEIRLGFENGLTEEQIRLYARDGLYVDQMREIRLGIESGYSKEQLELLFSCPNGIVFSAFQYGLTLEEVRLCTSVKDITLMYEVKEAFLDGLSDREVKFLINLSQNLRSKETLKYIRECLARKIFDEETLKYVSQKFDLRTNGDFGLIVEMIHPEKLRNCLMMSTSGEELEKMIKVFYKMKWLKEKKETTNSVFQFWRQN